MPNKQERVKIYLQEDMDTAKRSWLTPALEHEKGIISALFEHGNHHRLTIDFERDHFSYLTLLDTIRMHGYHGKIVNDWSNN